MKGSAEFKEIIDSYFRFGGLPECALLNTDEEKSNYLTNLIKTIYLKDVVERHNLNFRQIESSHLMENVVFNELMRRGYSVDVGMVTTNPVVSGARTQVTSEIDFVINKASERIYVQSAFSIPDPGKREQETYSLRHVRDSFRKIVITGDPYERPWMDRNGITFMGLKAFLLDPHSLETL